MRYAGNEAQDKQCICDVWSDLLYVDLVKLRYFHLISGKSKIDLRLKSLEKFAEIAHYNFFAKNISLKSKKKKKKKKKKKL